VRTSVDPLSGPHKGGTVLPTDYPARVKRELCRIFEPKAV